MIPGTLESDAEQLIEEFRKKIKTVAEEVFSEVYVNYIHHIKTDAWINFRNDVRSALCSDFKKPEYLRGEDAYARDFRALVFKEHREDLIHGLNQDLLLRVKELEVSLKRAWGRS